MTTQAMTRKQITDALAKRYVQTGKGWVLGTGFEHLLKSDLLELLATSKTEEEARVLNVKKFVKAMCEAYGMDEEQVLYAIQTDSQHDFLIDNFMLTVEEATQVIRDTEAYLSTGGEELYEQVC